MRRSPGGWFLRGTVITAVPIAGGMPALSDPGIQEALGVIGIHLGCVESGACRRYRHVCFPDDEHSCCTSCTAKERARVARAAAAECWAVDFVVRDTDEDGGWEVQDLVLTCAPPPRMN